jgi:3'-phosphoadenosine 5'-phosphosulfate sulfotransferase (PAPS reductase)/FAD synthetase
MSPPTPYEEIVAENGAPGPSQHGLMYIRLKERGIQALAAEVDADLHCWTGIRRWESDKRMAVAEPEGAHADGRWYWHAPLVDWHDETVEDYIEQFGLEPAEVVREIGRSADCWCGSFGDRAELVDLAAAGYEDHADWLANLETPDDCPREQQRWAGYNWDKSDWADEDDLQMTLCASCQADKGGKT